MKKQKPSQPPADSPEIESQPEVSDEQRRQKLEEAIEKNEKLAESGLEMAKLFIANGKKDIAKRRLKEVVQKFAASS